MNMMAAPISSEWEFYIAAFSALCKDLVYILLLLFIVRSFQLVEFSQPVLERDLLGHNFRITRVVQQPRYHTFILCHIHLKVP